MDFMRVLDQTVREIKREVNLKVLKVPEIEQKVLDATSDEAWGPHGTALSEIAQASKRVTDCQLIMGVLWMRLTNTGPNWRHVYKALSVIEYLISNGSERALDDIIMHISRILILSEFEYVEPNGRDCGINIRKKVENLSILLNDREKIKAAREKADATRDKYFGLSSTGITTRANSASYGSGGFSSSNRYGSSNGSGGVDNSIQRYENNDIENTRAVVQDALRTLQRHKDYLQNNSIIVSDNSGAIQSPKRHSAETNGEGDDFDDFDPRRSSGGTAKASNTEVSLIGDLLGEAPPSLTNSTANANGTDNSEFDLFADAAFQSASSAEETPGSHSQGNFDLFATQPAFPAPCPSTLDLLAVAIAGSHSETKPVVAKDAESIDPFAAIPADNFDRSKPSESFASYVEQVITKSPENSANSNLDDDSVSGAFASPTEQTSLQTSHHSSLSSLDNPKTSSMPPAAKDNFQVKSGIWADCLNRGLIDLNISSSKNLSNIGIVGMLEDASPNDQKDKGATTAAHMGRAMGAGSGLGMSGFSTPGANGNLSTFGQQQL